MEFFFFLKESNPPLLLLSSEARSAASRNILLCSRAHAFLTFTQRGVLHSSPVWIPNTQSREASRNRPTLTARSILTSSVLSLGFNTSHNPLFQTTLLQSATRMPAKRPYQNCFSKQVSHTCTTSVCTESTQALSESKTFINRLK